MKKIYLILSIIVISLIFSICLININKTNKELISVELDKCIDGDTARFKINNVSKKYRFLAINTKEVNTEFGTKTKQYVCDLLKDSKNIKIEYDNIGETKDKYNRELVWVYIDGKLLQEKLIEEGYAEIKYIYANYDYLKELTQKQDKAKTNKLGIWKSYQNKIYSEYFKVTLEYNNIKKEIKVLKNSSLNLFDNPFKNSCRFIGWINGNNLFDLSTKINKNYKLKAKFEC